jgi:biotin carboxyl carrier protein
LEEPVEADTTSVSKVETVVQSAAPSPSTPKPVASHPMTTNGADKKAVKAPMPGNITAVLVKPGDQVSAGQELCSLEAMKMNNAIRSPRDGIVATVVASPGQTVNHGDTLVTFE